MRNRKWLAVGLAIMCLAGTVCPVSANEYSDDDSASPVWSEEVTTYEAASAENMEGMDGASGAETVLIEEDNPENAYAELPEYAGEMDMPEVKSVPDISEEEDISAEEAEESEEELLRAAAQEGKASFHIGEGTPYREAASGTDGAGGTWTWDGAGTLQMTNVTLKDSIYLYGDCTIVLNGDNTVGEVWAAYSGDPKEGTLTGKLMITGPGVLHTNGVDLNGAHKGIYCQGDLTIKDTTLDIRAGYEGIIGQRITIQNSVVNVCVPTKWDLPFGIISHDQVVVDHSDVHVVMGTGGIIAGGKDIQLNGCAIEEKDLGIYEVPDKHYYGMKKEIYSGKVLEVPPYIECPSEVHITRSAANTVVTPTPTPAADTSSSGKTTEASGQDSRGTESQQAKTPHIAYRTHVQTYGWQDYVKDGEMSGTSGQAKRLEAINIQLSDLPCSGGIEYRTHVQTYGWQNWVSNGAMAGTSGEAKRLEAIQIRLTGEMANQYDVYYQTHIQTYGWTGWASNGEMCGSAGYAKRLEGIRIRLVKKGEAAPGSTANIYYLSPGNTGLPVSKMSGALIGYNTHVQTYGWQNFVYDGAMAGTQGQSKRLEGIHINLVDKPYSGDIVYRTHVQTYGWQDWKKNGEMSGTSGQSKRLEGIQIYLTGEMAKHYDVYYRVHAQTYGWLDWAKNGEMAGTSGLSRRLEGINIKLVPKGGAAPGSTTRPNVVG